MKGKKTTPLWRRMGGAVLLVGTMALVMVPAGVGAQSPWRLSLHHVEAQCASGGGGAEVKLFAGVLDETGNPVSDLTRERFRLREDNAEVADFAVGTAVGPINVALVIDTSGSMAAGRPRGIDAAKEAAKQFLGALGGEDQMALLPFNEGVVAATRVPLTHDQGKVINAINDIEVEDKWTMLYDAAWDAVKEVKDVPLGRRAVVLLTDGRDTRSRFGLGDAVRFGQENSVPIFAIGLGRDIDGPALERLATETGGRFSFSPGPTQLGEAFAAVVTLLRTEYMLTYRSLGADGDHTLTVELRGDGRPLVAEKRLKIPQCDPPPPALESPDLRKALSGKVTLLPKLERAQRPYRRIAYFVDKKPVGTSEVEPFRFEWDTSEAGPGAHTLLVVAYDTVGRTSQREFTLSIGEALRVVGWEGADLSRPLSGKVRLVPKLEGGQGPYRRVEYLLDDRPLGASEQQPFPLAWDTSDAGRGSHTLQVVVHDAAGQSTAQEFRVTVAPPPQIPWLLLGSLALIAVAGASLAVMYQRRRQAAWVGLPEEVVEPIEAGAFATSDLSGSAPTQEFAAQPIGMLRIERGDDRGVSFEIADGDEVGRETKIRLTDARVSRRHAQFFLSGGEALIRDLGSRHGTRIDGRQVDAEGVPVPDGARIQFGPTTVALFERVASSQETVSVAEEGLETKEIEGEEGP